MKKPLSLLIIILMIVSLIIIANAHLGTAQSGTNINGIITSDTTWTQARAASNSPAFIEYVKLENNSQNIVFSGLLVDGLNQKPIAGATINVVDSRNLNVYGQATTNESGRFAFNFPLHDANLSIKAEFLGDSQYQKYVSDTVNTIISSAPTPTPSVPVFPVLTVLALFLAISIALVLAAKTKKREQKQEDS